MKTFNSVRMPDGKELCTVPIKAALDCGHAFFGKYIEIIIGMLREHGAIVVFNANLDQFSLLQLGANLAANARFDVALARKPVPQLEPEWKCFHPRLDVASLRGKGGNVTCLECGVTVLVDEHGFWSATSPVATVTDRQAAGKSPCGHAIDQLRYDVPLRTIRCVQCAQEGGKGAS